MSTFKDEKTMSGANTNLIKLAQTLEHLIKIYQNLYDLLLKEKDALIAANLSEINEINKTKEAFLEKVAFLEDERIQLTEEICRELGLNADQPRLLELADQFPQQKETLKGIHSTITLLIQRVSNQNKENQIYAESALTNVKGALDSIKESLQGKPVYQKKGKMRSGPEKSGNFVSRKA